MTKLRRRSLVTQLSALFAGVTRSGLGEGEMIDGGPLNVVPGSSPAGSAGRCL